MTLSHDQSMITLGDVLMSRGELPEAEQEFSTAVDLSLKLNAPSSHAIKAKAYSMLGTVRAQQGHYAEAVEAFKESLPWQDKSEMGERQKSQLMAATHAEVVSHYLKLGDLEQQFSAFPSGESSSNDCTSCANPEVISKFPWLTDVLKCWADISSGSGGKVILRVRA